MKEELGIEINHEHAVVKRKGYYCVADFTLGTAEWHTFLVALYAYPKAATKEAWKEGYPTEWDRNRGIKWSVAHKLKVIDLGFKRGELKLQNID